ncbi:MAG: hypothetical protein ACRYFU_02875 [Janthinobacterium lividum]
MLVVGYYFVLLIFGLIGLWKARLNVGILIPQILRLGGVLGGIKMGGPAKYCYASHHPQPDGSGLQSLNLSGRRSFNGWQEISR